MGIKIRLICLVLFSNSLCASTDLAAADRLNFHQRGTMPQTEAERDEKRAYYRSMTAIAANKPIVAHKNLGSSESEMSSTSIVEFVTAGLLNAAELGVHTGELISATKDKTLIPCYLFDAHSQGRLIAAIKEGILDGRLSYKNENVAHIVDVNTHFYNFFSYLIPASSGVTSSLDRIIQAFTETFQNRLEWMIHLAAVGFNAFLASAQFQTVTKSVQKAQRMQGGIGKGVRLTITAYLSLDLALHVYDTARSLSRAVGAATAD